MHLPALLVSSLIAAVASDIERVSVVFWYFSTFLRLFHACLTWHILTGSGCDSEVLQGFVEQKMIQMQVHFSETLDVLERFSTIGTEN